MLTILFVTAGGANAAGGVVSVLTPLRAAMVRPASAASSSEMASARNSSESVSGTWEGGVKASGGVLSRGGCPDAGAAKSWSPQLVQTLTPGSL